MYVSYNTPAGMRYKTRHFLTRRPGVVASVRHPDKLRVPSEFARNLCSSILLGMWYSLTLVLSTLVQGSVKWSLVGRTGRLTTRASAWFVGISHL